MESLAIENKQKKRSHNLVTLYTLKTNKQTNNTQNTGETHEHYYVNIHWKKLHEHALSRAFFGDLSYVFICISEIPQGMSAAQCSGDAQAKGNSK